MSRRSHTTNQRITLAALRHLRGELAGPTKSGLCLQLVRLIVETALDLAPFGFYAKHRTHTVERAPGDSRDPWARDLERSLREQGLAILTPEPNSRYVSTRRLADEALPGDLLFRWDTARTRAGTFIGHVGVLLPGSLILENINPTYRPASFHRGATSLTPLGDERFPITLAARLP